MNRDFELVVNAVAEVMDLRPSQILRKNRYQETIDSRWLVVYLLNERGWYPPRIAEWMDMTPRNVNAILTSMHKRLSQDNAIGHKLEMVRKYLH